MKFRLETANLWYTYEKKRKLEKLGFKFEYSGDLYHKLDYRPSIDIKTIGQLKAFIDEFGDIVIYNSGSLRIYDDYIE